MKVLVTGDRNWGDRELLWFVLDEYHRDIGIDVVIEGCASGADTMAETWAIHHPEVKLQHHPAEWDIHGKAAGPLRNIEMLKEEPDIVLAFHGHIEQSKGTAHMKRIAEAAGVPVVLTAGWWSNR